MAYVAGDTILDDEYQNFASGADPVGINTIAGVGTGNLGLGQSEIASVTAGDSITASQWNSLFDLMDIVASHTGTSITSTTDVSSGDAIAVKANLITNMASLATAVQAGTVAGGNTTSISSDLTLASGAVFDQSHIMEVSFTWEGGDEARHFFNAGGKVGIVSVTNTATNTTGKDTVMTSLFSQLGSFTMGSTSNAVTGTTSDTVAGDANLGYYDLTTSYQTLFSLTESTGTYNASYNTQLSLVVEAKVNAAHADGRGNNGNVVTLKFTIDADDGVITDYNQNAPGVTGAGTTTTENNSCGPTSTVYGTVDPNTSGGLVVSGGMNTITVAKVSSTRRDDNVNTTL
jgi:hypothetical protein